MFTNFKELEAYVLSHKNKKRIVLANAHDEPALSAVVNAHRRGVVDGTLLGKKDEILALLQEMNEEPAEYEIVDFDGPELDAAKAAGSLSIDMVVLTPDCYSPKHGAGYKNMLQSEFIKSVIPADAKVIIAMPSTSVANNPAFYTVAPSQVSMLITDEALSPEMADQIEKSGVKVELA